MPTYQIITLKTIGQTDGSFDVFGIFWLSTPPGTAQPLSKFVSSFLGISSDDLALIQSGNVIEIPFSSRDAISFFVTFVDTSNSILKLPLVQPSEIEIEQQKQENPGGSIDFVEPTGENAIVPFPPGVTQDVVDQVLLSYFNELQNRLNKKTTPLPSAAGRAFDGRAWTDISLSVLPAQQVLSLANQ